MVKTEMFFKFGPKMSTPAILRRFNRLLHLLKKPLFIISVCNWINLSSDAVVT